MRRAIFKKVPLAAKVNGQREATVVVEQGANGDGIVKVRPTHSRTEF
jgi:hypothetical protein